MLSKLYASYCEWISLNPIDAADYETLFRWGSLFFSGQKKSTFIPELLYAISNLITLHNDAVILKSYDLLNSNSRIKIYLSVLEYSEIFLEIGASHYGTISKWLLISFVQFVKCVARLYLLRVSKEGLLPNPPFLPVERFVFKNKYPKVTHNVSGNRTDSLYEAIHLIPKRRNTTRNIELSHKKYLAEVIYTFKPMFHLTATCLFGENSWKPYITSILMDMASIYLHSHVYRNKGLSTEEISVLSQRYMKMLLYFLRSPFYERHSKNLMMNLLNTVSKSIPVTRTLLNPILLCLLKLQSVYFYMWSS